MPGASPVEVAADGDEWRIDHPDLDRDERYDEYAAAHEVAVRLAEELGVPVEVSHPRNVNLRRLTA